MSTHCHVPDCPKLQQKTFYLSPTSSDKIFRDLQNILQIKGQRIIICELHYEDSNLTGVGANKKLIDRNVMPNIQVAVSVNFRYLCEHVESVQRPEGCSLQTCDDNSLVFVWRETETQPAIKSLTVTVTTEPDISLKIITFNREREVGKQKTSFPIPSHTFFRTENLEKALKAVDKNELNA